MISAVDVETGGDVFFDTSQQLVGSDHLRASTAFMPLYSPVEIDGRLLCDPGVSANLPLAALVQTHQQSDLETDLLCIAVDSVSARGARPRALGDSTKRGLDLLLANQARHALEALALRVEVQELRRQLAAIRAAKGSVVTELEPPRITVLHLVYEETGDESAGKELDYSSSSIEERWQAGGHAMREALNRLSEVPAGQAPLRVFQCNGKAFEELLLGTTPTPLRSA